MNLFWALSFASLIHLLWMLVGWSVLNDWCRYSIESLRRELALNGVGDSVGDTEFRLILAAIYWMILVVWPVSVYRKAHTGRVIGNYPRQGQ